MLNSIEFPSDGRYASHREWEPIQFYLEALTQSKRMDLLLGYFNSSAISVLAIGFAKFLNNGGEVRMVINHILSEEDKKAIIKGSEGNVRDLSRLLYDFEGLKNILDQYEKHFFECLAWLIKFKKIQIRAVKPKGNKGIAHYKSGVFSDGVNELGFSASCNFTASGLVNNLEGLDAHCAWEGDKEKIWVENLKYDFEDIFSGRADFCDYVSFIDIEVAIKNEFGNKDLEELLVQENKLMDAMHKAARNKKLSAIVAKIEEEEERKQSIPKFPYGGAPRLYQEEAFRNWIANGYNGIFAMATGTGKTITSLNCILEEYKSLGYYRAVIVVPTNILVTQWEKEARKFNMKEIIKVSSKYKDWEKELNLVMASADFGVEKSFIIIVTYASFCKEKFQWFFTRLPTQTVLIADEAHNIASPNIARILPNVKLKMRIGLSATPKRIYDEVGSAAMEQFFESQEPYTYSFSMERAIEEKILCEYDYFPKLVQLTDEEMQDYIKISAELVKVYGRAEKDGSAKKKLEMLLMQRKRIIHKAHNKLAMFESILRDIVTKQGSPKYTLVYAPEGYFEDESLDLTLDELVIEDEVRIIDVYSSKIRKLMPKVKTAQYRSDSTDKDFLLKSFEKGELDVLLSMKCLDEGVDIPRTEQAIFCSSTGNPRQFIQRRGRILRNHDDKARATIYDMVVIPNIDAKSSMFDLECKLVKKELERVVHFAYLSRNKRDTYEMFKAVEEHYQLNLDTIYLDLKS